MHVRGIRVLVSLSAYACVAIQGFVSHMILYMYLCLKHNTYIPVLSQIILNTNQCNTRTFSPNQGFQPKLGFSPKLGFHALLSFFEFLSIHYYSFTQGFICLVLWYAYTYGYDRGSHLVCVNSKLGFCSLFLYL